MGRMAAALKNRVERLEKEKNFQRWFHFVRFALALTLFSVARHHRSSIAQEARWCHRATLWCPEVGYRFAFRCLSAPAKRNRKTHANAPDCSFLADLSSGSAA